MSEKEMELLELSVEELDQPEMNEEDNGEDYVGAYVGNKADRYIRKWNRGSMWNWSAFLMGIYWMLYRKMYLFTLLVLVVSWVLIAVIYQALVALDFPVSDHPLTFALVAYAIVKLSVGVIGDSLYQVHVTRKLANLSNSATHLSRREIEGMGGTHAVLPGILLSLQLLAYALVLLDEDNLPFKEQSAAVDEKESSAFAIRKGSIGEMALAITGYNWEDQVGYERLVFFAKAILEEWRKQGADLEVLGNDRTAEAELWAQMALEYFAEPGNRDDTLVDAMKWIGTQWPMLMASKPNEPGSSSEGGAVQETRQEGKQSKSLDGKLIDAVVYDEEEKVKQLLEEGANPDARDEYGQTALMLSGSYNRPGIMKLLLNSDADPTLGNEDGGNALLYALSDSLNLNGEINKTEADAIAMAEMLLQAGSDPDSRYVSGLLKGQTALMEASRSFPQSAQLLLTSGADPNVKNQDGDTALKYAISVPKLFASLLEHGANPNIKNNEGETVKDEIVRQNATETAELLDLPLERQIVTPPNGDVETMFLKLRSGISQGGAKKLFGNPNATTMDEEYSSEIWEYRLPGDLRLIIHWNGDGGVWYYEIESKGADDILYRYLFSPGDEKVVAS
ncbi:ankyrin repeat domain-containing protein [Cohnella cholangitidis]|uniref:DUF2628 domain-containing protein n=1 Tax=Cohnella cholangitidis TaxID=2598458 RepID=A0A7G5C5M4_9BACL|nr:ankyrin repeat domain-containing protein [Cohnella cholangitidis]QMV44508.1 DUF2628 domain-containing protein [Cohnella cholangitidis]